MLKPGPLSLAVLAILLVGAVTSAIAGANTSHAGWPRINGMLLMNKRDQSRPLDARPGHDPFAGTDSSYSCDGLHQDSTCVGQPRKCVFHHNCKDTVHVSSAARHNELLGAHGSDTIHAGPWGDVIWGDYKPGGQPSGQFDRLSGGPGRDFIYASHGYNVIRSGGGKDVIHAHYGRGRISCGHGGTILYVSRRSRKRYKLSHCTRISYRTLGY
jgi:RTX calcium-binding nonapeptide repeat (4 copies)